MAAEQKAIEQKAEEYLKQKSYTSGFIGYFPSGYCKQSFIDGYKECQKEHEWHFNSDIPKDRECLLCIYVVPSKETEMEPYYIYRCSTKDGGYIRCFGETVYAWKEIIPPKGIKE